MIVKIKLYAPYSYALGKKELALEIAGREEVSLDTFLLNLMDREKRLQELTGQKNYALANATVIVNQQVCDSTSFIKDGDQVSIISLVSGG